MKTHESPRLSSCYSLLQEWTQREHLWSSSVQLYRMTKDTLLASTVAYFVKSTEDSLHRFEMAETTRMQTYSRTLRRKMALRLDDVLPTIESTARQLEPFHDRDRRRGLTTRQRFQWPTVDGYI
ncbi:unnamed protein product [Aphanomyces euteiches]|nr:hypothetical protein Ae201684P_003219 [Aphanomyces euteiches]